MADCWNPTQYHKFKKERSRPFYDLLELIEKKPHMHIVDLGCGTGELTKVLHDTLEASYTLGIDSSSTMLKGAPKEEGLHFTLQNIEEFEPSEKYDLIFTNAALQWLPHHKKLIAKLATFLKDDGQIAIQMPASFDLPTHMIASKLAEQYLDDTRPLFALSLEEYSILFHELGFKNQNVQAKIYPLLLESANNVYEWVRGTLLTYYESRLPQHTFEEFTKKYLLALQDHYGNGPVFLPFKRLLLWCTNKG